MIMLTESGFWDSFFTFIKALWDYFLDLPVFYKILNLIIVGLMAYILLVCYLGALHINDCNKPNKRNKR